LEVLCKNLTPAGPLNRPPFCIPLQIPPPTLHSWRPSISPSKLWVPLHTPPPPFLCLHCTTHGPTPAIRPTSADLQIRPRRPHGATAPPGRLPPSSMSQQRRRRARVELPPSSIFFPCPGAAALQGWTR
jgi:hypothetical protein